MKSLSDPKTKLGSNRARIILFAGSMWLSARRGAAALGKF